MPEDTPVQPDKLARIITDLPAFIRPLAEVYAQILRHTTEDEFFAVLDLIESGDIDHAAQMLAASTDLGGLARHKDVLTRQAARLADRRQLIREAARHATHEAIRAAIRSVLS